VLDEASFVPASLWAQLSRFVHSGAKFLVLGDFRGQFTAAYNTWHGADVDVDVEESAFLRGLCSGRRFILTTNRRSDAELFDFYSPICRGGAREHAPIQELLAEARLRFPLVGSSEEVDWHLCVSNKARIAINRQVNEHQAACYEATTGLPALVLDPPEKSNLQQEIRLFPGLVLVGNATEDGVKNGVFYRVVEIAETKVTLQLMDTDETIKVWLDKITTRLRPAAALTYFSSQGRTLKGRVRLLDTKCRHFSPRHLAVGVGRATGARLVQVA
jgi:hypothetical protein